MSKTQHQEPKPHQQRRRAKRLKQWEASQPPSNSYPEPEVLPWKRMG